MKKLLALLGLSADASEAAAEEALTTLINRDRTATADLATMKNRATTAETELATAKTAAVTAAADAFCDANKAKIKNRDTVHAQYIKDPEGTVALFEGMEVGKVSMKNRSTKQPGAATEDSGQTNAQQLESKVQEYRGKNRDCSYDQAFDAIARAHPELLKKEAPED